MIIQKDDLLDILNKTKVALAVSDIWEPGIYFHFRDGYLFAFDGAVYIQCPFDTDFEGSIKGVEFHKLISKLSSNEINLECKKDQLVLKSGKATAKLLLARFDDLPVIAPKKKSRVKLPPNFWEGIKFCSFSTDKKLDHPQLSAIYIDGEEIISCDNYRATKYNLEAGGIGKELIVPITGDFSKYGFTQFYVDDEWIHFYEKEGIRMSCRLVEGDYPEVAPFFKPEKGEKFVMPVKLEEVIDRTKILMESSVSFFQDQSISIVLKKNNLTCRGEGSIGYIQESMRTKYNGPEIKFSIHPVLLNEIIGRAQEAVIGETRIIFTGENFMHVIGIGKEE